MKLTKVMKKLKFWSKKKKKKRAPLLEQPPSPLLPCYYHCPYNYPIQPSAPPLPPWFEYYEQQQPHDDSIFTAEQYSGSTSANLNQPCSSTVIAEATTERAAGAFGCVINFGAHLFRCFFPCFHIRELK